MEHGLGSARPPKAPQADKAADLRRYEVWAKNVLACPPDFAPGRAPEGGSASADLIYRAPYLFYERAVADLVRPEQEVLELGSGMGAHTKILLDTGAKVTASDLSPNALAVLERNLGGGGRLSTRVADLEALPFAAGSFDVVACAGSLSYGDPVAVDKGVRRVLRPGGAFVCVDSLNHNPIYRLNRWVQHVRGKRTRSTLIRMPSLGRIEAIGEHFESFEIRYFGTLTWAMPLAARILGPERASQLSDICDKVVAVERSAFKFVLIARGRR